MNILYIGVFVKKYKLTQEDYFSSLKEQSTLYQLKLCQLSNLALCPNDVHRKHIILGEKGQTAETLF